MILTPEQPCVWGCVGFIFLRGIMEGTFYGDTYLW